MRERLFADRSQFYRELSAPFYGANRPVAKVSDGLRQQFWLRSMQVGQKGAHGCIAVLSETGLTEDLHRFDIPTLSIYGEDDHIVPIGASARIAATITR